MMYIGGVTLAALMVLGSVPGGIQQRAEVSGLWLAESRSEGGLGSWFDFRGDGTVRAGFGAVVESTYRMDGTSLSLMPRGDATVPPMQMRIKGNTAVRQQPAPAGAPPREAMTPEERAMFDRMTKPLTMTRVGKAVPGAAPIVGTWTYAHPSGAPAYERFTRDGNMVLLVEMQASDGTYATGSEGITVTLPSGSQKFKRAGETLVTTDTKGQRLAYRRAAVD